MDEINAILFGTNMYDDGYNQALEDFITEIEKQTTFYCGEDSHLRQIVEQLKR